MTVKALIEKLQTMPQDATVFTPFTYDTHGYKAGDIEVRPKRFRLYPDSEPPDFVEDDNGPINAVILGD